MAKKKQAENISPEQLKRVWSKISAADWQALLEEHKPGHQWSARGNKIVGCCVYHQERTPSMHVDVEQGRVHCFGGSCPTPNNYNPIRFVADVMNISYVQAIRHLKNRYGVSLPASYSQNAQQIEDNEDLKRAIAIVMNRELRDALEDPSKPEFDYIEEAGLIPWLRKRQLPEDVMHRLPIGVMPTNQRLYERLEELPDGKSKREAAFQYLRTYLATPGNPRVNEGALVFFYFTSPSTLGRFRIRLPNTKTYYSIDDPYTEEVGFFGLNLYPELMGHLDAHPPYMVEGEFDVLSVVAHQFSTGHSELCMLGTGGHMKNDVDALADYGFENARLVPDNDEPGTGWARDMMEHSEIASRVFQWDSELDQHVKDVDEAIRAHGFPEFYKRLCRKTSFMFNHEWAAFHTARRLEIIDDGDVDARNAAVVEFGKALRKDTERDAFLDTVCEDFGVSREWVLQDMIPHDTPDGFHQRIVRCLKEDYSFLYKKDSRAGASIFAWSNGVKAVREFTMESENKVKSKLESDFSAPMKSYVARRIGLPDFVLYKPGPRGREVPRADFEIRKILIGCFMDALVEAAADAQPEAYLTTLDQGVHFISDEESEEDYVFIINGSRFFKGTLKHDRVIYEELSCPVHGKYIFRIDEPWSVNIQSVKDLESSETQDPKETFYHVKRILDLGWKFKNQDIETTFLAADVLYTAVASVFGQMVFTDISGDTHSGKSTLLQLIGGKAFPGYRLCEATKVVDDRTVASIRQQMAGKTLRLLLDEFETDGAGGQGQRSGRIAQGLLAMLRSITIGGANVSRGTSHGEAITYNLNFPMTVGGIYTMNEKADVNRFVHIRTRKIEGFVGTPIDLVAKHYDTKRFRELRRAITLCWFSRLPELLKTYEEVKEEFSDGSSLPPGVMSRMLDNLYPGVAIMKFVGEDYHAYMKSMVERKMEELKQQGATASESGDIWEEILHAPVPLSHHSKDEEGVSSVARLLRDPHKRFILDKSDLGVYFIEQRNWLIVFWKKAIASLLRHSPRFRDVEQHTGRIKLIADEDSRVISGDTLMREGFLKKYVWPTVAGRISIGKISVIDLSDTIEFAPDKETEPALRDEEQRERVVTDLADDAGPKKPDSGNFDV